MEIFTIQTFYKKKLNVFMRFFWILAILIVVYFAKSYSQENKSEPQFRGNQQKLDPQQNDSIESKTTAVTFEASPEYRYEPVGKRDPFRPFRDSKVGVGSIRTQSRPLEPLENYDVKTLQVVAIVWSNEKPKALIQDPDKGLHSVVIGQRIGKNEGYIAEIREGEVIVIELFDLNGKIIKEPFILCIDKTKGCGA